MGSSSIRFALFEAAGTLLLRLRGKVERIGLPGSKLIIDKSINDGAPTDFIDTQNHIRAAGTLIDWLEKAGLISAVKAVGHRVVHGGSGYSLPAPVDDGLVQTLREISAYSPEHLPRELEIIERFRERLPNLQQVACFDTAFHRDMPRVAQMLPIPRRLDQKGIRRFGFHGLSYAFLMEELERVADTDTARGRVILAHLGNGSSLAAVRQGIGVDTTMAFTPAAGVPMSTRSGDLDPGLAWYLARSENMSTEQFHRMVNHEFGLLGVSETSSDMRDLLAREGADVRAAEAVGLYCYQVKKAIGAFAAALGGLDTLVFAGGIGENSPVIRQRICEGLEYLGIALDHINNAKNEGIISSRTSAVIVRMMCTDEEAMIARATERFLQGPPIQLPTRNGP